MFFLKTILNGHILEEVGRNNSWILNVKEHFSYLIVDLSSLFLFFSFMQLEKLCKKWDKSLITKFRLKQQRQEVKSIAIESNSVCKKRRRKDSFYP